MYVKVMSLTKVEHQKSFVMEQKQMIDLSFINITKKPRKNFSKQKKTFYKPKYTNMFFPNMLKIAFFTFFLNI